MMVKGTVRQSSRWFRMLRGARVAPGLACGLMLLPAVAQSQQGATVGAQRATRSQLTGLLSQTERGAAEAKPADRARLLGTVAAIRGRLELGDFKPGDRFVMTLRQDSVRADTLVVRDSLRVAVLNLPEFSVAGVLRAELEDQLSAHVARYLRNASVRTTQLVRVSVTGGVRNPGFYYAGPDRPLNDLLTSAGGPLMEANLNNVTVSRLGRVLLDGKQTKQAVEQGRTLEELDVQGGDTVHLPLKRKVDWRSIIQFSFVILSLFLGVLQFLRWYYDQQNQ
jgi:hypothetical protein